MCSDEAPSIRPSQQRKARSPAIVVSNHGGRQLKALILGARGALIGKEFLNALAAEGAGVTRAIEITREKLRVTMALVGKRAVRCVHRRIRDPRAARR